MDSENIPSIAVSAIIRLRGLPRKTEIIKTLSPNIQTQEAEINEIMLCIEYAARAVLLQEYADILQTRAANGYYEATHDTTSVQVFIYYNNIGASMFESKEIPILLKDVAEKEIFNWKTIDNVKGELAITAMKFFGDIAKHHAA